MGPPDYFLRRNDRRWWHRISQNIRIRCPNSLGKSPFGPIQSALHATCAVEIADRFASQSGLAPLPKARSCFFNQAFIVLLGLGQVTQLRPCRNRFLQCVDSDLRSDIFRLFPQLLRQSRNAEYGTLSAA